MTDASSNRPDGPTRTTAVLLEHTLPDGSAHLDLLIERPGDDAEHRMIAFRCETDPFGGEPPGGDPAGGGSATEWTAARLPDHRAHYIEYEGPVSGDRGTVRRLWRTTATVLDDSPARFRVRLAAVRGSPTRDGGVSAVELTLVPATDRAGDGSADRPAPPAGPTPTASPEPVWVLVDRRPAAGRVSP